MTEYSHGSGCGCKIAPGLLEDILAGGLPMFPDPRLLVGNDTRDDAAVYNLGDGRSVISTTDFFMPVVDDPSEFGYIAAANAISDIYAMGGEPLMALAIFGWPVDKLGPETAAQVVDGGRAACADAGIALAGGHSIDAPEPLFGLAVTGIVDNDHLKRNNTARPGGMLFLTKPIGIGILTTAQKRKLLLPEHARIAPETMRRLNHVGAQLGRLAGVLAMTDVTGFGLLGHLREMCEGSGVHARLAYEAVPKLPAAEHYCTLGCSPGGAQRNWDSYGHLISPLTKEQRQMLCDPQTSGGLLVAVSPEGLATFQALIRRANLDLAPIGELLPGGKGPLIQVD